MYSFEDKIVQQQKPETLNIECIYSNEQRIMHDEQLEREIIAATKALTRFYQKDMNIGILTGIVWHSATVTNLGLSIDGQIVYRWTEKMFSGNNDIETMYAISDMIARELYWRCNYIDREHFRFLYSNKIGTHICEELTKNGEKPIGIKILYT